MPIIGVIASSAKGAPAAPVSVSATDVGTSRAYNNGAATVSFTPGAGATATSFTATSSPGGFTATGASSPLTVAGLQSGVSYTFTVTATNASGTSAASSASNSITATTVPQAPTIGTATGGDTTASITFTAGATGGKTVSTFTATSSPSSITGTNSTSPITVSGLTNGTAYTFTVTATNANGTSTASAASNSVTPVVPPSFESIATVNGTGSSNTITFTSIPSTYKHLQIRYIGKTTQTGATDIYGANLRLNGQSADYSRHVIAAGENSVGAGGTASTSGISLNDVIPSSDSYVANVHGIGIIDITDYTSTSQTKTVRASVGVMTNRTSFPVGYIRLVSGQYFGTPAAVTSISLICTGSGNWTTTSSFALYGIKG